MLVFYIFIFMYKWYKIKCEFRYYGILNKYFESIVKGVDVFYWYYYLMWGYCLYKFCSYKVLVFFNLNLYFICYNLLSFYFICVFMLSLFFISKSKLNFFLICDSILKLNLNWSLYMKWVIYICLKFLY